MLFRNPFWGGAGGPTFTKIAAWSALTILILSQAPVSVAQAASTGLMYDEVTKFVVSNGNPQPGTFATDFQTAVNAGQQTAQATSGGGKHHGLFAGIQNAIDMGKSMANSISAGTASRVYFYGNWTRRDDLGAQTAEITKPDQHQIIYLNLAKKTYRIVDTSAGPMTMPEAPPAAPGPNGATPPPAQPGSGKLDVSVISKVLGPMTLEGVATTGYSNTFSATETQSTGSCSDGTFQVSSTEYVSNITDPETSIKTTNAAAHHHVAVQRPESLGLRPGCSPKTTYHKSGSATAPSGKLAMWMLIGLNGSSQPQQGQMGGGFRTLVERGNVRALGAGDKGLFGIPAGFTVEQPSPPPQ